MCLCWLNGSTQTLPTVCFTLSSMWRSFCCIFTSSSSSRHCSICQRHFNTRGRAYRIRAMVRWRFTACMITWGLSQTSPGFTYRTPRLQWRVERRSFCPGCDAHRSSSSPVHIHTFILLSFCMKFYICCPDSFVFYADSCFHVLILHSRQTRELWEEACYLTHVCMCVCMWSININRGLNSCDGQRRQIINDYYCCCLHNTE